MDPNKLFKNLTWACLTIIDELSYSLPIHPKATCTSTTQLKQQINPFFTRVTEKIDCFVHV